MLLSFSEICDLLFKALSEQTGNTCPVIVDVYTDNVIFNLDERYFQCSYSISDNQVTLGQQTEVEKKVEYLPLQAACTMLAAVEGGTGYRWKVKVIEFGPDKAGAIFWDKQKLLGALNLFDGAKVFALDEAQHMAKSHVFGKSVKNIVGVLSEPTADETAIYAVLTILPSAAWLHDNLMSCRDMRIADVYALSVDISAKVSSRTIGGKSMKVPELISAVSVDIVYEPAAGGKFLQLAAAVRSHEGKDMPIDEKTLTKMQLTASRMELQTELADSKLPDATRDKLKQQFSGRVFDVDELRAAIKLEKEYLDRLTASGSISGAGSARVTLDAHDKSVSMLDDFFAGKQASFKAAYIQITGDERVTGDVRNAVNLRAAINSGTFDQILGDAITRRMLVEYNASGLDTWKKFVSVVPILDFRTQHRPRLGGYGDLPTVAQSGSYNALTTPADEEATYATSKKGGTEIITLEAIKNDDVSLLKRVPTKLARAASRTLYKFVFDMIGENGAVYDALALFHASHANLGATALSKASLSAGRLAMMKQTEAGSGEQLGIPPHFILVPADLEDTAYELTVQPNLGNFTPTQADAVRRQTWEVIPVKHWSDVNNWYLIADPADIPTIEVGFMDGKEAPELFVQDMPNVGSMFSNDQLTYKIRHIYGGAVMDYRGFYGAIVP
jgi:hypothetical protein